MENEVTTFASPGAKLTEALSKAQGKIKAPLKNRTVDFIDKNGRRVKYNYADLADVIEALKIPFAENGLAIIHRLEFSQYGYGLKTVLAHSSGEFIDTWYPLPDPLKQQIRAQEFGSALTYARRYSVSSLVGIASEEDDDGGAAAPTEPPKKPAQPSPPPQGKPQPPRPAAKVTEAQVKRLYTIATANYWTHGDVHDEIKKRWQLESAKDLDFKQYNILVGHIETHGLTPPAGPSPDDESFDQHPPEDYGPPQTMVDQLVTFAAENNFSAEEVKSAIVEVTGKLKKSSDMTDIEIQGVLRYLRILQNNRQ